MPYLASIAVALWLGSLVHLILSVSTLFAKFPKLQSDVAIEGAPAIFHVSEIYHLALAVISIIVVITWQRMTRERLLMWTALLLMTAGLMATVQIAIITPKLDAARAAERRQEFDRLHHLSTAEYVWQTVMVFTAALSLPAAIRFTASRETARAIQQD